MCVYFVRFDFICFLVLVTDFFWENLFLSLRNDFNNTMKHDVGIYKGQREQLLLSGTIWSLQLCDSFILHFTFSFPIRTCKTYRLHTVRRKDYNHSIYLNQYFSLYFLCLHYRTSFFYQLAFCCKAEKELFLFCFVFCSKAKQMPFPLFRYIILTKYQQYRNYFPEKLKEFAPYKVSLTT